MGLLTDVEIKGINLKIEKREKRREMMAKKLLRDAMHPDTQKFLFGTEEEAYEVYQRGLVYAQFMKKYGHMQRNISEIEAIHIFRDELEPLCYDHISAGDNPGYWKSLLYRVKSQKGVDFQEKMKRAKAVPIMDIIRSAGHEPKMNFIRCPFHGEDRTPSLKIYPDTNTWHCHACHAGVSTIDFIMQLNSCTLRQAIDYLI